MMVDLLFSTGYKGFILPYEAAVPVGVAVVVPVGVAQGMSVMPSRTPQFLALCLPRAAFAGIAIGLNKMIHVK